MTDPHTPPTLRSQQLNGANAAAARDPRLAELKTPDWNTNPTETKDPFATAEGAPAPKPAALDALAKRLLLRANEDSGGKLSPEQLLAFLLEAKVDKSTGPAGFSPAETLALKALDRMGYAMNQNHDIAKKPITPVIAAPKPRPAPPAPQFAPPKPR